MSEIFDRLHGKIDTLAGMNAMLQEIAIKLAGFLRSADGAAIAERIQRAETPGQLKLALDLIASPDASQKILQESTDDTSAELEPYLILLEGFAKGTATLADKGDSIAEIIASAADEDFANIDKQGATKIASDLGRFYSVKRSAMAIAANERTELKSLAASLMGFLNGFSKDNTSFHTFLRDETRKISEATSLADIKKLKSEILVHLSLMHDKSVEMGRGIDASAGKLVGAQRRIKELESELEMARQEKWVDALTGVFNRGHFDITFSEAVKNAVDDRRGLSLIIFDIDHFKNFNDNYGHRAGDRVLAAVAAAASENVRKGDVVNRYGGEEFAVILRGAGIEEATAAAERIRAAVENHEFVYAEKILKVTISLGVAEYATEDTPGALVERADKRLYAAKSSGRNRVIALDEAAVNAGKR